MKKAILIIAVAMGVAMAITSCGPNKRQKEATFGVPNSIVLYSGRYKILNDSVAKLGYFIYEKHKSKTGELRWYCANPNRE